MASVEIRALPGTRCETGEGIVWCSRRRRLFWVDIGGRALYSLDPSSGEREHWSLPAQPGCLALTQGDEIVLALPDGVHLFDLLAGSLKLLAPLPPDAPPGHRANDGATSRGGRFVFGTMPLGDRSVASGSLYRWDGAEVRRHFGGLHVVNGIAFSPDDRTAYVSDSYASVQTVWALDHDSDSGALSNRREFFRTDAFAGRPDGACIDVDGCYWMAGVGGFELLRITPAGKVDVRIELPVRWPTKPCFGGHDLRTIYVTSLRLPEAPRELDGYVLEIPSSYQGLQEPRCALPLDGLRPGDN